MRRVLLVVAALAVALATLPLARATADAPSRLILDVTGWSRASVPMPGDGDGIGPGSYLLTTIDSPNDDEDGTFICTGNFVWRDAHGVYLGAAGHCFLPLWAESAVGTNPWVTRVEVCVRWCAFGGVLGAQLNGVFVDLGPVVYARQHKHGHPGIEIGHDFGLVTIPAAHTALIRPAMPVWGGPVGEGDRTGQVCMFGNGLAVGEVVATKARTGSRAFRFEGDGWDAAIAINGGDSGAAINLCRVSANGFVGAEALGIVTHGVGRALIPTAWAMGTKVSEAKAMVLADTGRNIEFVNA